MIGGKPLYAFIGGGAAGAAASLTTNGTIHTFTIPFKCIPIRAGVTITTAVTVTSPVLTFGAAGICGAITIPVSTAANYTVYDDTDYVSAGTGTWAASLDEGDQVAVVLSVQATAGAGIPFLIVEVSPEMAGNNSVMIKSA